MVHSFASRHEWPGFNPQGSTYVKPGFSCWRCLATWVTPTWLRRLRQVSSWTVTRPSSHPTDNVIILLDLTQLFCPGFMLDAGPPSGFTTDIVGCWGEPCGEPAISLNSYTVPLVQWSTCLLPIMRDPHSIPRGVLMWNQDSPVGVVLLQYCNSWDCVENRVYQISVSTRPPTPKKKQLKFYLCNKINVS